MMDVIYELIISVIRSPQPKLLSPPTHKILDSRSNWHQSNTLWFISQQQEHVSDCGPVQCCLIHTLVCNGIYFMSSNLCHCFTNICYL